jgi:ABC-type spermidine/putrescine transport system permease subunit I
MYTQTAVVIGTAYILLPYMILTVYAALKNINPAVMNAATSLGASEIYAFIRVYLPLSAPGLIGGSILVFLLCLGYFVTPSLMGGPSRQMIGVLIQNEIEVNVNWAMASALSLVLLLVTLGIVFIYSRFVNLGKILQGGI